MTPELMAELHFLDAAERAGQVLTGGERGRLADLRREEILETVQGMLPAVSPVIAERETR